MNFQKTVLSEYKSQQKMSKSFINKLQVLHGSLYDLQLKVTIQRSQKNYYSSDLFPLIGVT